MEIYKNSDIVKVIQLYNEAQSKLNMQILDDFKGCNSYRIETTDGKISVKMSVSIVLED